MTSLIKALRLAQAELEFFATALASNGSPLVITRDEQHDLHQVMLEVSRVLSRFETGDVSRDDIDELFAEASIETVLDAIAMWLGEFSLEDQTQHTLTLAHAALLRARRG